MSTIIIAKGAIDSYELSHERLTCTLINENVRYE